MSGHVQRYGAKMTVRFVLAWMLLSGLLIVGCRGESNSQPGISVNDGVGSAVEPVAEAPAPTPYGPSMGGTSEVIDSEVFTQALKENSDLKTLRDNLIQELNNLTLSPQKLFVPEESLKAMREMKEHMSNNLTKVGVGQFLENEINRLSSERKRLENLGLPYDYDFPESGFPIERKAEVLALAEGLRSSVVKVRSGGRVGTGFVIGNDLVLTNEHVISGEGTGYRSGVIDDIIVETLGGVAFLKGFSDPKMIGYDKLWDLALLRIGDGTDTPFSDLGISALTFGDSKKLEIGDPLFTIGHPGQMGDWVLTAGVLVQSKTTLFTPLRKNYDTDTDFEAALALLDKLVASQSKAQSGGSFTPIAMEGAPGTRTIVETTVPGMIGSSGSPIFNVNGEVIALRWGSTSMEVGIGKTAVPPGENFDAATSFNDPAPHIMHSVPVHVSREWTSGSPAWKIEELIAKWLDVNP